MKLSVKPVPAARTLMRTSPVPGFGIVGSSASSKTSGPPNRDMRTCCHDMGTLWHIRLPLARLFSCRRFLWMSVVAFGLRLRQGIMDVAYGSFAPLQSKVSCGSIASPWQSAGNFRSSPTSRHSRHLSACRKRAKRRHARAIRSSLCRPRRTCCCRSKARS